MFVRIHIPIVEVTQDGLAVGVDDPMSPTAALRCVDPVVRALSLYYLKLQGCRVCTACRM